VPNAQNIAITLTNVSDGTNVGNVSIPMGVLAGDTNADRFVNSADITQTKSQSGAAVGFSNFREDVNVDGLINSADITFVKSKSGSALPPASSSSAPAASPSSASPASTKTKTRKISPPSGQTR